MLASYIRGSETPNPAVQNSPEIAVPSRLRISYCGYHSLMGQIWGYLDARSSPSTSFRRKKKERMSR